MGKIIDYINTNLSFKGEYERIFDRTMPTGKVFCPFHHNVNTPAAKLYGNVLHCFSCNRNYSVYDLLKTFDSDRIKEIAASSVITQTVSVKSNKIHPYPIDNTKSLKYNIDTIANHVRNVLL